MPPDLPPLGIVAGGGRLPEILVSGCARRGRPVLVVQLDGQGDPARYHPHATVMVVRPGRAGRIIKCFKDAGVTELVFAGSVLRPTLSQVMPDWWAAKFLARTGAYSRGDDGLLRAIVRALEVEEGFSVTGPDQLMPDIVAPAGRIAGPAPDSALLKMAQAAVAAARELGRRDLGQAVVFGPDGLIAEEGKSGTEGLVNGAASGAGGGILVKVMKPGQERRVDLPAIGPDTVDQVVRAGLNGVAVEAGNSLILDWEAVRDKADQAGISVFGLETAGVSTP
ncbi:MAG: UDP-2,3-diacylglucosamine diphosphatase LpxI [Rhodospirillaceae bacterium]